MSSLDDIRKEINRCSSSERAQSSQRYFKTGKGQYGEGDVFIGLTVPQCRTIAKAFRELDLKYVEALLNSKIHEERLIALLILVDKYKKSDNKKQIFDFYLSHYYGINNWDLVDLSSSNIVGDYLIDKDRNVLHSLAKSDNLWKRRIAIVSTFAFIKDGDFEDALKICEILLGDKHDLIHKATGWMLREIGKKDVAVLKDFLKNHYSKLPRTTLRYAIERFPEDERKKFLRGEF